MPINFNYDFFIENYHPISVFFYYLLFVYQTRSIILLSAVRHPWDENKSMPSFTVIITHVIIFSGVEGIWSGKESLGGGVVLKMLDDSDRRG